LKVGQIERAYRKGLRANRTKLGLKVGSSRYVAVPSGGANRTKLGLKGRRVTFYDKGVVGANRTKLGLKVA